MELDDNMMMLFEFSDLDPAVGNVAITFFHSGDDAGYYDLFASTFALGQSQQSLTCGEYIVSPANALVPFARFNNEYVESGVLKVSMNYDDPSSEKTCERRQKAFVNLKYQLVDCSDPSSMPSSTPNDAPSSVPSTMPSSKPSTMPSSKPSTMPSSKPSSEPMPSSKPSSMPSLSSKPSSCVLESYDLDSAVMELDENMMMFFEFPDLEPAVGDVHITYYQRGHSDGYYDLFAGTFSQGQSPPEQGTLFCLNYNSSPAIISFAIFNEFYVENGVLKASMNFDDPASGNTCSTTQEGYVKLRYQYISCD
jgi:hypothetical protein